MTDHEPKDRTVTHFQETERKGMKLKGGISKKKKKKRMGGRERQKVILVHHGFDDTLIMKVPREEDCTSSGSSLLCRSVNSTQPVDFLFQNYTHHSRQTARKCKGSDVSLGAAMTVKRSSPSL